MPAHLATPGSTHELLVRLLASELGLAAVLSPDVQQLALVDAFEPLRARVLAGLKQSMPVPLGLLTETGGTLWIPGARDAELFTELYRSLNTFANDADALLREHVNPLIGRMVNRTPELEAALLAGLAAHCARYPEPVRHRIVECLRAFGLNRVATALLAAA